MDNIQFGRATAVTMVRRAIDILCRLGVGIDFKRVLLLVLLAIVVVVVVEADDFRLQACTSEGGSEGGLDEVALLIPRHVERHGVAPVERLVLHGDGSDGYSRVLERLYPPNEIGGIVLVVVGVEVAAHPIVVGVLLLDIIHFHPSRATPRCTHHFQVGVDGQYLAKHGDDIVQLVGGEGEVINALYVATGVVVVGMGVEVATSYGHAYITISHSVLHAESLA